AIEESRRLTYDLSPPILYELGLLPAIKWKLEQFEKDFNISTKLIIGTPDIKLSKENNIFLYRTIGELLTNTNKHAYASKITIKQDVNKNMYCISVEDDGKGIDKTNVKTPSDKGGFGLLSISERIENMNGTFKIEATKKGTLAEIEIPYTIN
ncbi:MAG TPA: ATP-binding protein, partial [Draconibacterium sp.]|nr:ATP-binding protein [Draconibacterium sp.]